MVYLHIIRIFALKFEERRKTASPKLAYNYDFLGSEAMLTPVHHMEFELNRNVYWLKQNFKVFLSLKRFYPCERKLK